MSNTEILTRQTVDAYSWSNKLIESISFDLWETIPDIIETSVIWQVGHIIMSNYFHSIIVIKGHDTDILQKMPLKDYRDLFSDSSPKNATGKTKPKDLLSHLKFVQEKSIEVIKNLSPSDLKADLEPIPFQHPVAKIKQEAIEWNVMHTMYHCGQIGILKRILDKRYDFGLRRSNETNK